MSGQIRISPDQMRERVREVVAQQGAFGDVINKMQGIINALQGEWEGQASSQFAEQFEGLRPYFDQMHKLMGDLAEQLNGTAEALEGLDREIAGKFR